MDIFKSFWFWLFYAVIVGAIFIILLKWYTVNRKKYIILLIILFGILEAYGYYRLFQLEACSKAYPITRSLIIVIVVLAGILLFCESITPLEILGIIIIITGIIVFAYGTTSKHK